MHWYRANKYILIMRSTPAVICPLLPLVRRPGRCYSLSLCLTVSPLVRLPVLACLGLSLRD